MEEKVKLSELAKKEWLTTKEVYLIMGAWYKSTTLKRYMAFGMFKWRMETIAHKKQILTSDVMRTYNRLNIGWRKIYQVEGIEYDI